MILSTLSISKAIDSDGKEITPNTTVDCGITRYAQISLLQQHYVCLTSYMFQIIATQSPSHALSSHGRIESYHYLPTWITRTNPICNALRDLVQDHSVPLPYIKTQIGVFTRPTQILDTSLLQRLGEGDWVYVTCLPTTLALMTFSKLHPLLPLLEGIHRAADSPIGLWKISRWCRVMSDSDSFVVLYPLPSWHSYEGCL